MTIGLFNPSLMGMYATSHTIAQISTNVANVNTTGYKRSETLFKDLIAKQSVSGTFMGVTTTDRRHIETPGTFQSTSGKYDLAINGDGFFLVNDSIDGNGNEYYTRAGDFKALGVTQSDGVTTDVYLGTQDDFFVMGWNVDENGEFTGDPAPVSLDAATEIDGISTTEFELYANLPSDSSTGTEVFGVPIFDNNFESQQGSLIFTKQNNIPNYWQLDFEVTNGTVSDPVAGATFVRFNLDGELVEPAEGLVSATFDWDDGTTTTTEFDLSGLVQQAGTKTIFNTVDNGRSRGKLIDTSFNREGILSGSYDNGLNIPLSKVAQIDVQAPNMLEAVSHNLFRSSPESGNVTILGHDAGAPNANFLYTSTIELSNVDIGDQFTKMIATQKAYSSAATAFRTTDEILQEAVALKG